MAPNAIGKQGRRRPEIHSLGQHPLRISAQQKLFKESRHQEKHGIIQRELDDASSVQSERPEGEGPGRAQHEHENRERRDSTKRTHPEIATKRPARRKPEVAERTAFDPRHDKARQDRGQHHAGLRPHAPPHRPTRMRMDKVHERAFDQQHDAGHG